MIKIIGHTNKLTGNKEKMKIIALGFSPEEIKRLDSKIPIIFTSDGLQLDDAMDTEFFIFCGTSHEDMTQQMVDTFARQDEAESDNDGIIEHD